MEKESLARSLKRQRFVEDLTDEHVAFLSGCTKNVRYSAGEYLCREGDEADQVFLVRKGKVSLEIHAAERGTVVVETVHAGEIIGSSAIFPPHRWNVDARATKDALVFAVDATCLRDKLERDHGFGYAFTRSLLRNVTRRLDRARLQLLDVFGRGASP